MVYFDALKIKVTFKKKYLSNFYKGELYMSRRIDSDLAWATRQLGSAWVLNVPRNPNCYSFMFKVTLNESRWRESPWRYGWRAGLQLRSKRVRIPVVLLGSLLNQYPWEGHEPPYPSSYWLNNIIAVLPWGWVRHKITYDGWYAIKHRN